jgi:hypothetical protein
MQKRIKAMAAEIQGIDRNLAQVEREIDLQRALNSGSTQSLASSSGGGGGGAAPTTSTSVDKHVRVMENRLDKALTKYNLSLSTNKTLRGTIDHLRRERVMFDTLHRKFEKELLETKKRMADIIEASNAAYESRCVCVCVHLLWEGCVTRDRAGK